MWPWVRHSTFFWASVSASVKQMVILKPCRVVVKISNHVYKRPGHLWAQTVVPIMVWALTVCAGGRDALNALINHGIKATCYSLGKDSKSHTALCFEEGYSQQNIVSLKIYPKKTNLVPRILYTIHVTSKKTTAWEKVSEHYPVTITLSSYNHSLTPINRH